MEDQGKSAERMEGEVTQAAAKPSRGLRVVWMIPVILLYVYFIGYSIFIIANGDGLKEIGAFNRSVFMALGLLLVAGFGSYQVWNWIKEGRL